MLHSIETENFGPRGKSMAEAVQTCVHCGFCLPTCPTYEVLGEEMDSPRGRIILMKEVLEGRLEMADARPHIDRCLGCVACETACPSGVQYGHLISPFRDEMRRQAPSSSWAQKLARLILPHPTAFRLAMHGGTIAKRFPFLVPKSMRPMIEMVPHDIPKSIKLKTLYPAEGTRIGRVALLAGCAQQVLAPDINISTIRVLNHNGIEVVVPPTQGCCGALAWHVGQGSRAIEFARRNLDAFPMDVDAIITNAAGCGSGLHEYPLILKCMDEEPKANRFAEKVCDVTVFLQRLAENNQLKPFPRSEIVRKIAYQDACHLAHAQKVTSAPRALLNSIPGVKILEIPSADLCCGSAGTYNLDQPEIAADLGRRKAEAVAGTNCDMMASGNIGCMVQIEQHLRKIGRPLPVLHTVQILDRAYIGKL